MVALVDIKGNIMMANPLFYETLRVPDNNKPDFSYKEFIHPKDVAKVEKQMHAKLSKKNIVKDLQFRVINTDGNISDVECSVTCLKKEGNIIGFQMVMQNIAKQKKFEEKLIEFKKYTKNTKAITVLGLAKIAEYRDKHKGAHFERIREYVKIMATALVKMEKYKDYITKQYIDDIYLSSVLHDIGKIGIPDSILLKPGKLTPNEFNVVKQHPSLGGDALKAAETQVGGKSFLTIGKQISYHHHERWDGTGYPLGLMGEEIPLSARLVALADVYDALTSTKIYKDSYSHETAREKIISEKGKHFDPDIVDVFFSQEYAFIAVQKHRNESEYAIFTSNNPVITESISN